MTLNDTPIDVIASLLAIISFVYFSSKIFIELWVERNNPSRHKTNAIVATSIIITVNAILIISFFVIPSPWSLLVFILFAVTQSFTYITNDNTNKYDTLMLIVLWSTTAFMASIEYTFYIIERLIKAIG